MVLRKLGWCVKNAIPLDSDEFQYLNLFWIALKKKRPNTWTGTRHPLGTEAYNRTVTEQAEMPLGRPNQ